VFCCQNYPLPRNLENGNCGFGEPVSFVCISIVFIQGGSAEWILIKFGADGSTKVDRSSLNIYFTGIGYLNFSALVCEKWIISAEKDKIMR
jgi:hypothetical protein